MKQNYVLLGAFLTFFLVMSTVTAVPYNYSQPAMDTIEKIEEKRTMKNTLQINSENTVLSKGIIDWIIQILLAILHLIQELISFVLDLLQIVTLIEMIISAIMKLITVIFEFIQAIIDLINPNFQRAQLI
jgi:hypothetical protein